MSAAREKEHLPRAPTLYGIIVFKLVKGSLFVALAITAYALSDNDLPFEYRRLMAFLQVHPGNQFFANLAVKVGKLTEAHLLWTALGTLIYSSFSLVEGAGMIFRQGWAGWLAIAESAFFVPLEIADLLRGFSWGIFVILVINVIIVWYLFQNRTRLFHHHHHHPVHARHTD
ncbi:MAG TPA: DUF2127 domain-containing protein [Verrucomicrobiae bacterium]|jgi:uncharacterized membrane protein (DUF2068 family)